MMLLQRDKVDYSELAKYYLHSLRWGNDTVQYWDDPYPNTIQLLGNSLPASVFTGPPVMPLQPGERLDGFTIDQMLGHGGMSYVYQAIDASGSPVAIKTPKRASPWSNEQLGREFRIMQAVSHRSIAKAISLHQHSRFGYIAIEQVRGTELKTWLRGDKVAGQLPDLQRVYQVLDQLCDALAALHRHGIAHRDLKPANVMIDSDGRVVLIDFGIATRIGSLGYWTDPHIHAATINYLAPEIILKPNYTCASDLFSLGRLLFWMLAGRLPQLDLNATDHWSEQRFAQVISSQLPLGTPSDLANICIGLQSFVPADRPSAQRIHTWLNCQSAEYQSFECSASASITSAPAANSVRADGPQNPTRPHEAPWESPLSDRFAQAGQTGGLVALMTDQSSNELMTQVVDWAAQRIGGLVLRGRVHPNEHIEFNAINPIVSELAQWLQKLPASIQNELEIDGSSPMLKRWPILNWVRSAETSATPRPSEPAGNLSSQSAVSLSSESAVSLSSESALASKVALAGSLHGAREFSFVDLGNYFARLTQERSVVLCIEQLQFADEASWRAIELLHQIGKHCSLVVLATLGSQHRMAAERVRTITDNQGLIDLAAMQRKHPSGRKPLA